VTFPEKGEAGASVDPGDSDRVHVVTELKEAGNGVMVPASEEERKGTLQLGLVYLFASPVVRCKCSLLCQRMTRDCFMHLES
jgi:hypothetical protein